MPNKPTPKPTAPGKKNDTTSKGKRIIAPLPLLKDDLKKIKNAPPVGKKNYKGLKKGL
jgi:hypothetical protein